MDLYQVCSNYMPGAINGPTSGSNVLHRLIKGKRGKIFVWNQKALTIDIWYLASPSRPLPSLFKLYPWGQKGGQMFNIGLYRENVKKSSCLKPWVLEPWYFVCSITKWTSTNFVQNIVLGPKMAPPSGQLFYMAYKENMKKPSCLKQEGQETWYLVCSIT